MMNVDEQEKKKKKPRLKPGTDEFTGMTPVPPKCTKTATSEDFSLLL